MTQPDLLIDADMYLYQAAKAAEVETDWGDDKWTLHSDAGEVRRMFKAKVQAFVDELGGTPILCFSDPSRRSFRHDLTPTYKQSRAATRKPLAYASVRGQMAEEFKTIIKPRLEADDVMGIISTRAPGKYIIVSGDKDMRSIPGKLYCQDQLTEISEFAADRYHMLQTLTGDLTDGYVGCPGTGAVAADKVIKTDTQVAAHGAAYYRKVWWAAVVAQFKSAGLAEADALLQARLARILRASDWDFEKGEVILWTPAR